LVMREKATRLDAGCDASSEVVLDTCGTGGDVRGTFNISTAAALIAAAAGVKVVKHGNRSASGRAGSADVLEALGVKLDVSSDQMRTCLRAANICFAFARQHHPAMKFVAAARTSLGIPTIFNILGPLTNPAGAPNQLMGVFHPDLVGIQVRVLQRLGSRHVLVVYGMNGMDEISLSGETMIGELKEGEVREYVVHPSDFGLPVYDTRAMKVADREESIARVRSALANEDGPVRDIVLLNAGAALYASDAAPSIAEGVRRAREAVQSGRAAAKLEQFVAVTRRLAGA